MSKSDVLSEEIGGSLECGVMEKNMGMRSLNSGLPVPYQTSRVGKAKRLNDQWAMVQLGFYFHKVSWWLCQTTAAPL